MADCAQIPCAARKDGSSRGQLQFQTAGLQRKGATRSPLENHTEEEQLGCIMLTTF